MLVIAYEVERLLFRLALALLVWKLLSEAWAAWRRVPRPTPAPPAIWPLVTVQLPLYNERGVAERAIRAVAALDYPALEIQVLDDSDRDDETRAIVDRVVAELAATGLAISFVRRDHRDGAKAGALANALATVRGELVAIFDADFLPQPDFLIRVVPHFAEARVGMVQGRWEHINRRASVLTRAQALIHDGLMLVEQPGKDATGRPFHFNGTAGVWRGECIADAGGWGTSITEDLELSERAVRRGWRMVHLPEIAVPSELPETMRAYRTQQRRWTRGNAQVLRRSWRATLSSTLPLRHRLTIVLRCSSRVMYLFLVVLSIGMPLTTFGLVRTAIDFRVPVDAAVFGVVLGALYVYYLLAERRATGSVLGALVMVPVVMALQIGLAVSCAVAFVVGLVRRGPAEFVRTPKRGDRRFAAYVATFDVLAVVECAIGAAYVAFAVIAVQRDLVAVATFFAFWAVAHLWTGGATIIDR